MLEAIIQSVWAGMVPIMSLSLFVIAAARLRGIVDDFAPYDPQHGSHGYGKSHGAKSGEGSKYEEPAPLFLFVRLVCFCGALEAVSKLDVREGRVCC